ncbi:MAG: biotin--[acetyl-CoA-carboxylase] ligase [Phycisphaerales bacterium JB041]
MTPEPPITDWADRLEAVCAARTHLGVHHVHIVAETASTQDAAWAASGGAAGWLVVAGRQAAGRGRLGRSWADTGAHGLAMTMTLPAGAVTSVGVGVAVCRAARASVSAPSGLGLRWPNDVVERASGRKVAGVLIEVRDGVALVGVGVNVRQTPEAFPPEVRCLATSLAILGGTADRISLAERIVRALDEVIAEPRPSVAREATLLDTLVGTRRRFVCDGTEHAGLVRAIDSDGTVDVETGDGVVVRLPADTTSLVHV